MASQCDYRRLQLWPRLRWGTAAGVATLYVYRVWTTGGFYLVTYCVALALLYFLSGFLTPKSVELPSEQSADFRPFIREVSELRLWEWSSLVMLTGVACTFFGFLNIPVCWQVLAFYFLCSAAVIIKTRIAHMQKHDYVPWSAAKRVYIEV